MMTSLLTMPQVMVRLGYESDDDTYEETMPNILPVVTAWFEGYCDRGLARRTVVGEELWHSFSHRLYVWTFPLLSLTKVVVDDNEIDVTNYAVNSQGGYFMTRPNSNRAQIEFASLIKVDYVGGYENTAVPDDLAQAFAVAVGLYMSIPGVVVPGTSGSSAIKSIGLGGGALSVAFDTGASPGGIKGGFSVDGIPVEVQQFAGVLNRYARMRA
jgi:hypothetical protein